MGHVTIVDAAIVTEKDRGQNFFIGTDDIGKVRAQAALAKLLELNSDVNGIAETRSVDQVL